MVVRGMNEQIQKLFQEENLLEFFSMMAEKIVEDPMEADVVVTDHEVKCTEEAQIIREYDFEKIRMLMEDAK